MMGASRWLLPSRMTAWRLAPTARTDSGLGIAPGNGLSWNHHGGVPALRHPLPALWPPMSGGASIENRVQEFGGAIECGSEIFVEANLSSEPRVGTWPR